jgi:hypothetical protein
LLLVIEKHTQHVAVAIEMMRPSCFSVWVSGGMNQATTATRMMLSSSQCPQRRHQA